MSTSMGKGEEGEDQNNKKQPCFVVNVGITNTESGGNSIVSSAKYGRCELAHHPQNSEDNHAQELG